MMDHERFEYLTNGYFDGQLSPAECEEFDALVISDSKVREAYWEFAIAHATLRLWGEERVGRRQIAAASHQVHTADALAGPLRSSLWQRLRTWGTGKWSMAAVAATVFLIGAGAWINSWQVKNAANRPQTIAENAQPGSQISNLKSEAPAPLQAPSGKGTEVASHTPVPSSLPRGASPVARLARAVDIRWGKGAEPASVGGDLVAGQKLHIESGIAEIVFPLGVELRLQGPARLTVESDRSVFLADGRLSARLTRPEGRSFRIGTPKPAEVVAGTEAGPTRTQVAGSPMDGRPAAHRPSSENEGQGLWRLGETREVTLLSHAMGGLNRSLNPLGHDPHTVAYWRFEDQPPDTLVPNTDGGKKPVRGAIDSSGNGNDVYTWNSDTAPRFSGDVAAAAVAQSGKANRGSLDNSAPLAPNASRDMYTKSLFSHPSPIDLQTISPQQWTIEASVKPAKLWHLTQIFVGRDGSESGAAMPLKARMGLGITSTDHFMITFIDADQRPWAAVARRLPITTGHWYHVAATSDGRVLRLYVDAMDGRGYQLQAAAPLPASGNTALGMGSEAAEWSIGRGKSRSGQPAAWFQGWIDEVRISDVARPPGDFLFAAARGAASD